MENYLPFLSFIIYGIALYYQELAHNISCEKEFTNVNLIPKLGFQTSEYKVNEILLKHDESPDRRKIKKFVSYWNAAQLLKIISILSLPIIVVLIWYL